MGKYNKKTMRLKCLQRRFPDRDVFIARRLHVASDLLDAVITNNSTIDCVLVRK